jgi:hypothetical protein
MLHFKSYFVVNYNFKRCAEYGVHRQRCKVLRCPYQWTEILYL